MLLDQVITDHSKTHLEQCFSGCELVAELPFFSILAKNAAVPWLLFIPKAGLDNSSQMLLLYGQMLKLGNALQARGRGHYNLAKIGNKNPWLHFHLVFRHERDGAWPDAIWCHEPLAENPNLTKALIKEIKQLLLDAETPSV
ncbi:MAG: hypothetical protein JXR44_00630 [Thiotrichales bacterium]|nr:hypothetical protein [Thiotrichales bacterium]